MVILRIKNVQPLKEAVNDPLDPKLSNDRPLGLASGQNIRKPNDQLAFWGSYFRKLLDSDINEYKKHFEGDPNDPLFIEKIKDSLQKIVYKHIKAAGLQKEIDPFLKLSAEKAELRKIEQTILVKKERFIKQLEDLLFKFENPKSDPNDKYNKEKGSLQAKYPTDPVSVYSKTEEELINKIKFYMETNGNQIPDEIRTNIQNSYNEINLLHKQRGKLLPRIKEIDKELSNLSPRIESNAQDYIDKMAGTAQHLLFRSKGAPEKERISLFHSLLENFEPFWLDYFIVKEKNHPSFKLQGVEVLDNMAKNISEFLESEYKNLNISIREFERQEKDIELYNMYVQQLTDKGLSEQEIDAAVKKIQENIKNMSLTDVATTINFLKQKNYKQLAKSLDAESRHIFMDTFAAVSRLQGFIDQNKEKIQEIFLKFRQKEIQYKNNAPSFKHSFDAVGLKSLSDNEKELFSRIPPQAKPFEELTEFVKLANAKKDKANIGSSFFFSPPLAFVALYSVFNNGTNDLSSIITEESFLNSDWGNTLTDYIKENLPPVPFQNIRQILELKKFMTEDVETDSDTDVSEFSIVPVNDKFDQHKPGKRKYLEKLMQKHGDNLGNELFRSLLQIKEEIKVLKKEGKNEEVLFLQEKYNKEFEKIYEIFAPICRDYMAQRYLDTTLIETENFLAHLLAKYGYLLATYDPEVDGNDIIEYLVENFEEFRSKEGQRYYIGARRLWAIPTSESQIKALFDMYAENVSVSKTARFDLINREIPYGTDTSASQNETEVEVKPGARDVRRKGFIRGEEIPKYQIGKITKKDIDSKEYIPTQDALGSWKRIYDDAGKIITHEITQEDINNKKVFTIPVDRIIPKWGTTDVYPKKRVQYEAYPAESVIKNPKIARRTVQATIRKQFDSLVRKLREIGGIANRFFPEPQHLGKSIRIKKNGKTVNHIVTQSDIDNKTSFSLDTVIQPTVHAPIKEKFIPTEKDIGREVVVYELKKFKKSRRSRIKNKLVAKRHKITAADVKNGKTFYIPQRQEKTYTKTSVPEIDTQNAYTAKIEGAKSNRKTMFAELLMMCSGLMNSLNISADEIWKEIEGNIQSILASTSDKYPKSAEHNLKRIIKEMMRGNYNEIFDILYRSQDVRQQKTTREFADATIIQVINKCIIIARRGMEELDQKFESMELQRLGSSYANAINNIQETLLAALLHHVAKVRPFRRWMNDKRRFEGGEKAIYNLKDQGDGSSIVHPSYRALIDPQIGVKRKFEKVEGEMWQQPQDASSETKQTALTVLMNIINRYTHRIKSGLPHYEQIHKMLGNEIDRDIKRELRNNKRIMRFGNSSYTWGDLDGVNGLHNRIVAEFGDKIKNAHYRIESPEWFQNELLKDKVLDFITPIIEKRIEKDLLKKQRHAPRGEAPGSEVDKKHKVNKRTRSTKKLGGAYSGTSPDFKGDTSGQVFIYDKKKHLEAALQEFEEIYPEFLRMKAQDTLELDRPVDKTDEGEEMNFGDVIESLAYSQSSMLYEYIKTFDTILSRCFSRVSKNYGKLSESETTQLNGILKSAQSDVNKNSEYAKEYFDNYMKNIDNEDIKTIIAYKFFEYFYIREYLLTKLFTSAASWVSQKDVSNQEVKRYVSDGFRGLVHKPSVIFDSTNEDLFNLNPSIVINRYFSRYINLLDEDVLKDIISYIGNSSDTNEGSDAEEFGKTFVAFKRDSESQGSVRGGEAVSPQERSRVSQIDKSTMKDLGFQNVFLQLISKTEEDLAADQRLASGDKEVSRKEFMQGVNFLEEFSKIPYTTAASSRQIQKTDTKYILDSIANLKYYIPIIKNYILSDQTKNENIKDPSRGIENVSDQEQNKLLKNLDQIILQLNSPIKSKFKKEDDFPFEPRLIWPQLISLSKSVIETLDKLGELPKDYRAKVSKAKTGIAKNKKEDLIDDLSNLLDLEENEIKTKLTQNSRTLDEIIKVSRLSNPQKSAITRQYKNLISVFEKEKVSDEFKKKLNEFKQELQKVEIKFGDKTEKDNKVKLSGGKAAGATKKKEDLIDDLSELLHSDSINLNPTKISAKLNQHLKTLDEIIKVSKKPSITRQYKNVISIFEKEKLSKEFIKKLNEFIEELKKTEIESGDEIIKSKADNEPTPDSTSTEEDDLKLNKREWERDESGQLKVKKDKTPEAPSEKVVRGLAIGPNPVPSTRRKKIKESVDPNFNILVNKLIGIISSNAAPTGVLRFKTKDLKKPSGNGESEEKRQNRIKSLMSFMIRLHRTPGEKVDKYTIYNNPEIFTKDYIITEPDTESENENDFITYVIPKHIVSV